MTTDAEQEAEAETIRALAEACQNITDSFVNGDFSIDSFHNKLKDLGLKPAEVKNYFEQAAQRLGQIAKDAGNGSGLGGAGGDQEDLPRGQTPEGLTDEEAEEYRLRRDAVLEEGRRRAERSQLDAIESTEWAILTASLASIQCPLPSSATPDFSRLQQLFGMPHSPALAGLSSSLLKMAPHLADDNANDSTGNPHLDQTWSLQAAFGAEVSELINKMQRRCFAVPIPRSIWRLIIMDQYVDFEKLFASIDAGYSHLDEPKDFHAGYALVKKDQATARKPLFTEGDWMRVFGAWEAAVTALYIHRMKELAAYRHFVVDLF